ncbi:MAG: RdgB/HAM1 family non-canonical purine NTP pyrophosphatase [Gammaproteobacteria bacterium]|nr:RdgB/HAM1 family non-canonical purine NTP pyrophosphatase [Gammaproteobacteria bacterium]
MSDRQLAARVMVIASGNAGKIREFTNLLAHLPLDIKPQPTDLNVEETGSSFAENARIKATAVAKATGHWALADDSGLSVIALNGAPGVHSARYAPTDSQRISRLLRELDGIENRHAHFNAALCIASASNEVLLEVEGRCDGVITKEARGLGGFGYDPIFKVKTTGLTFAEMTMEQKRLWSHRGRAFKLLYPELQKLLNPSIQAQNTEEIKSKIL